VPDASVPSLAALAHEVRLAWCGPEVEVEGILSAKTGGCPEDCHFCSQSAAFDTPVKATPFLDTDEVLAAARETAELGASEFCIVLAVKGPDERTLGRILELVPIVREETGLNVAVSAGILTEDQARRLAEGGVHRYNHNLETARVALPQGGHHPRLGGAAAHLRAGARARHGAVLRCAARHGRVGGAAPRAHGRAAGRGPHRGAGQLLEPPPGYAARRAPIVGALEAIRWIALFRLALPSVILRYAGGREITLRELQALGLTSGINALIVGNYLTTLGRTPDEDLQMLDDLQMPIGVLGKVL
jgi:biotin synthase